MIMTCYIKIKHHNELHTFSKSDRANKYRNIKNTRQRKNQTKPTMSVMNNYNINKKELKKKTLTYNI